MIKFSQSITILRNETKEAILYRNSKDKRVKQTASQLFDAIYTLLESKSFDDIGIKEVSELAGIGRATFYRNFDYVEDVLKLKLDEQFDELRESVNPMEQDYSASLQRFFSYWVDNPRVLKILINAGKWDIFSSKFSTESKVKIVEVSTKLKHHPQLDQYVCTIFGGMFSSILHTWIDRGQIEDAKQLCEMFDLPFQIYQSRVSTDIAVTAEKAEQC